MSVEQTGSGHFSPISGYHSTENKILILDVARFKYPSHWMDTQMVYDSLAHIDSQSGLSRGFILVSRDSDMFADICRVSQDYTLMGGFTQYFREPSRTAELARISQEGGRELVYRFLEFLKDLPPKYADLLTLFIIQISFSLGSNVQKANQLLMKEIENSSQKYKAFEEWTIDSEQSSKYPVLQILSDYEPKNAKKILGFIYSLYVDQFLGDPAKTKSCFHHSLFI